MILYGCRVLLILFCIPIDICTLVVYACLLAYRYFSPETALAVAESQSKNVILMVHGSGADDRQFILARSIFKNNNCRYTGNTINLSRGDCTIEEHAKEVSDLIEKLQPSNLILVGVSMGGLVACYYANFLKPTQVNIKHIFTIGTPFKGAPLLPVLRSSCLAKWFQAKRYTQMQPNSTFLSKLNQAIANSSLNYTTFGSYADIHVPEEYSFPALANFKQNCAQFEHIPLLYPAHIALTVYPFIFTTINDRICDLYY
jgi:pimeloyl-ACP methyl ester carboxylesterase